jgi:hypothetical protein
VLLTQLLVGIVPLFVFVGVAAASNAAMGVGSASRDPVAVPRWLYLTTGGATIGASALLASFVTDRTLIRAIHRWQRNIINPSRILQFFRKGVGFLSVGLLVLTIYLGFTGPQVPTVSFAIVLVFIGFRAGFTMATYLVGNIWPALNPWRTITTYLPHGFVAYPESLDRWPAVGGLLVLILVETVLPVTRQPRLLAIALLLYSFVTILGSVLVGPEDWFENADPVSVFFLFYGQVSPFTWDENGLSVQLPGMALISEKFVSDLSDIAMIVLLVWELTFTGFVTTQVGNSFVSALAGRIPALLIYLGIYLGGFGLFLGGYLTASKYAPKWISTFKSPEQFAKRFAPPLLAIAAGYHLAHYFGFFLSLSPSMIQVIGSPFSPPANPTVLTLPAWVSGLNIAFVLLGHLLAIWVAHSIAYEWFPSRMQAIRSQYPFIGVMIVYTVISLWLISLPTASSIVI